MRKFLSMLLVLTLMFALAVPAFAEHDSTNHEETGSKTYVSGQGENTWNANSGSSDTFDVYAKITRGTPNWGAAVYKIGIEWSAADVTEEFRNQYVWTPNDTGGTYTLQARNNNSNEVTVAPGTVSVTVNNHSNDHINAVLGYVDDKNATGAYSKFTLTSGELTRTLETSSLNVAEGTTDTLSGTKTTTTFAGNVTLTDTGIKSLGVNANKGSCVKLGTFTLALTPVTKAATNTAAS